MSELDDIIERLKEVNALLESIPEGAEVFARVRDGRLSAEEATHQLMAVAAKHGLLESLTRFSQDIASLVPTPTDFQHRPAVMQTTTGISQLNPLFEAAIAERSFFDGDVPEFRTGRIPEGGWPAVPVITDSLDPVVVGVMLGRASQEVAQEISAAIEARDEVCERLLSMCEGKSELVVEATKRNLPLVPTGVKGYEAGRTAALRKVDAPTMEDLSSVTPEEQVQLAFLALTSTQGRTSLAPAIENALCRKLQMEAAIDVDQSHTPAWEEGTFKEFVWYVEVFGQDLSTNFSPATNAVSVFYEKVLGALGLQLLSPTQRLRIQVSPLNLIAERRFGWILRVGIHPQERG